MPPVDVVIDTNVLIAALKSKHGAAHRLLLELVNESYRPNVSVPLFIEYESVAKRTGLVAGLETESVDVVLNYFLSKSSIREIFYLWRPILRDPKDDLILEVAVESNSKYIITFNKRDFKGAASFGIKVASPQEFINERGIVI